MAKDEEEDDLLPDKDAAKEFYAKYEPKEILGRGISSTVRRCIEKETGREYAAKIIDLSGAATETDDTNPVHILEATHQEISILRQVMGHPYIIELQDVFESDAFVFLVFELCSKGELFDYLTSVVTLSEKKTRTIMRQIFEGVEYIHSKNIVHRDLKPENILLDDNHNVKITDFGFARQMDDNEMLTDLCGTPGYLAPETLRCNMFEGAPGYGREVDIWACGVIMFTLLVGCPPFWHRKQMVMLRNIMEGKYSFTSPEWTDISEEPKDVIRKCLVVDPAKRIKIREVLRHPFFNQVILLPELSYDGQKTTYHLCEQNVHNLREYSKNIKNNHNLRQVPVLQQQKSNQQHDCETAQQKLSSMIHQQQHFQHLQGKKTEQLQQEQQNSHMNKYNLLVISNSATLVSHQPIQNDVTQAINCLQTKSIYQTQFNLDVGTFTNINHNVNDNFKASTFITPTQPAPKAKIKHHYNHHQQQQQRKQQQQHQHEHLEITPFMNYVGLTLAYGPDYFPNTQKLRKQNRFNARKKFLFAMLVVRACIRIKRLHYTAEPLHVEDAIRDPYRIKVLRKIIDGCAFRVYGHWVKKGEGQNRAALFENTPRTELHALFVSNVK